jgi:hypothetical protein
MDSDADPDPVLFVTDLQEANKKLMFFNLLLFEGTFTSFSKIRSPKEVQKTVGIKVFLTIFA